MKIKKLFLVRHADYDGGVLDPSISELGKMQARKLAKEIRSLIDGEKVEIWTSSASRAKGTAQIIKQEMQLAELAVFEELWSDNQHRHDYDWLKKQLANYEGEILIIVSHLEYVRYFPEEIGYAENSAGYAEGVLIADGKCTFFPG